MRGSNIRLEIGFTPRGFRYKHLSYVSPFGVFFILLNSEWPNISYIESMCVRFVTPIAPYGYRFLVLWLFDVLTPPASPSSTLVVSPFTYSI